MLKKTISYTDYNGNDQTEDFYFNLSKAEIARMELLASNEGGFSSKLTKIIESNNPRDIIETFEDIVLGAYGVRSDDGKRFIKNPQAREEFSQTEAYSELFTEIVTDAAKASDFINALVPQSLRDAAAADVANMTPRERSEATLQGFRKPEASIKTVTTEGNAQTIDTSPVDATAATVELRTTSTPAEADLTSMSQEELAEVVRKMRENGIK